jgi:hypothetical protein
LAGVSLFLPHGPVTKHAAECQVFLEQEIASMKRVSILIVAGLSVSVGMLLVAPRQAFAIKPFKDAFEKKYLANPTTDEEKALKEAVGTAKCDICHQGENKKKKNPYGAELAKLLKKSDKDNAEKIAKALETVEAIHSDAADDKSPTFGDLIKKGKLPGAK